MKYNFNQPLRDLTGEPITENGVQPSFKNALTNALLAPQSEQDGVEKVRLYELARKVELGESDIDLTLDEVETLKKACYRTPPLVCGQIVLYLQSANAE